MKSKLLLLLSIALFFACKNKKINQIESSDSNDTVVTNKIVANEKPYGTWTGLFISDSINYDKGENYSTINRISIVIQNINNDDVKGYSVVAGNIRPFTGTLKETDSTRYVVVKEPGDHKYDGTFKFNMANKNDSIFGEWISKRKDLPVITRIYNLKKSSFKYDPKQILKPEIFEYDEGEVESYPVIDWFSSKEKKEEIDGEEYVINVNRAASDAIYNINASTTKLTEKELKNLRKLDLEIIRNTIYARHGYSFSNKGVRQYFDFVEWYIPLYTNVEDKLTQIEKDNIALLKRLEKYAEDYYQQYGR